ncbi:MAG: hypothetical protein ACM3ML_34775 [Micromonosporaceae bacterium]
MAALTQHVCPPRDEEHYLVTPAAGGTRMERTIRWPTRGQKKARKSGKYRITQQVQAELDGYKTMIEESESA